MLVHAAAQHGAGSTCTDVCMQVLNGQASIDDVVFTRPVERQ
jgi:hypothetical protein